MGSYQRLRRIHKGASSNIFEGTDIWIPVSTAVGRNVCACRFTLKPEAVHPGGLRKGAQSGSGFARTTHLYFAVAVLRSISMVSIDVPVNAALFEGHDILCECPRLIREDVMNLP